MPRVEALTAWRFFHVAFCLNDYNEIQHVCMSFSRARAVNGCYRKIDLEVSEL